MSEAAAAQDTNGTNFTDINKPSDNPISAGPKSVGPGSISSDSDASFRDLQVPVSFKNLTYRVKLNTKEPLTILNGVSGSFEPGRLSCLMGPSGCGKTTLLDLLCGRKTLNPKKVSLEGEILYAGTTLDISYIKYITGYVEQFDTLVGELSVRQMLLYTAELKLGAKSSEALVDGVISKLGLENCKNTTIGGILTRGISGGQAKRTNIAMALLTRPPVIMLDEPTTGLDSFMANEVVMLMKNLACEVVPSDLPGGGPDKIIKRTVIATIHSPTAFAFSLFDDILLMCRGRIVYAGQVSKAKAYFIKVGKEEVKSSKTKSFGTSPIENENNGNMDQNTVAVKVDDDVVNVDRSISKDSDVDSLADKAFENGLFSLPEWLVDVVSGSTRKSHTKQSDINPNFRSSSKDDLGNSLAIDRSSMESINTFDEMMHTFSNLDLAEKWVISDEATAEKNRIESFSNSGVIGTASTNIKNGKKNSESHSTGNESLSLQSIAKQRKKAVSTIETLKTLFKYRSTAHYKDPEWLGPRIGDKIMFAILIVSLYWGIGKDNDVQSIQSVASLLFFIVTLCGFGAASFVPTLTLDRPLFYREWADGCYGPLTYYANKIIEESFLCFFTSTLFSIFVFYALSLDGSIFVFILIYYLNTMIGVVLAYATAALCPTVDIANAALPTYVTFCLFFSGFFILYDNIPVYWQWFSWTCFLRYGWAALSLNHFEESKQGDIPAYVQEGTNGSGTTVTPLTLLQFYDLDEGLISVMWFDIAMCFLIFVFFVGVGGLVLVNVKHGDR